MCVCGLTLLAVLTSQVQAQDKQVNITKQWKGSVAEEKLQKEAPEVITNAKDLEKVWKAWKIDDPMPKIDFMKEIIIVTTGSGSKLNLSAKLDDKGNMTVIGFGTADFVPGFRWVMGSVSKEGVKTVNKKALPAE